MSRSQQGFSLIELLIVVAIILVIASIAIPNMLAARARANEASAVQALRSLNSAQSIYNTSYADTIGYAANLSVLGPSPTSTCDQNHACLVDLNLGCASEPCQRGAYNFFSVTTGGVPALGYSFTATPTAWNLGGDKNFCTIEDSIIRFEVGATQPVSAAVAHDACANFAAFTDISK
ncbi:MAG TPA: type II secretion system protein [Candidatus Angelobacter sp.]|nr:type II secretion system protein [Candidatus Angelobacter sp.]